MPAATIPSGKLVPINDCYIAIPIGYGEISVPINNLPDITDSKTASYNDETVIGRASPLKTYSQSDNRTLSVQLNFFVTESEDINNNLSYLRAIQSAAYPRMGENGVPFVPPPICRIKCGRLLSDYELCVILKQYSVKFPTEVAWDEETLIPFKFSIDTSWDVVYKSSELPGQERIRVLGK